MTKRRDDEGYVGLTWVEVRLLLGRDYEDTVYDKAVLAEHLISEGAPEAIREASLVNSFTDESGWYVRTR